MVSRASRPCQGSAWCSHVGLSALRLFGSRCRQVMEVGADCLEVGAESEKLDCQEDYEGEEQ